MLEIDGESGHREASGTMSDDLSARLLRAANEGSVTIVESILGAIEKKGGPAETDYAAQQALHAAVAQKHWSLVHYLAHFLIDTERTPPLEGGDQDVGSEAVFDISAVVVDGNAESPEPDDTENLTDTVDAVEPIEQFVRPADPVLGSSSPVGDTTLSASERLFRKHGLELGSAT